MNKISFLLGLVSLLLFLQCKSAVVDNHIFYVSKQGNDSWSGTLSEPNANGTDGPFLTITKASLNLKPGAICFIKEGIYRETLKPLKSGNSLHKIVYSNFNNEKVIITGTDLLHGKWVKDKGHIYKIPFKKQSAGIMIYSQGNLAPEASWPNSSGDLLKPNYGKVKGGTYLAMAAEYLPEGIDLKGAILYGYFGKEWALQTMAVSGYDSETKTVSFPEPKRRKNYYGGHEKWMKNYGPRAGNRFYIKGHYDLLDENNEWYLNEKTNTLYMFSNEEIPLQEQNISVKVRDYAIDISNVSYVDISGIEIFGAGVKTDSATTFCIIKQVKGYYVDPGISIAGSYNEVNNCEFAYSKKGILNVSGNSNRIINNYIHDGNYTGDWGEILNTTGYGHLVSHNTVARSGGGSIGPGGRNMRFQYNTVTDAGLIRHDIGGFYIANNDGGGTVISHNRVQNIYGIGIYLDNSTSNYIIHHNVVWNCGWQYVLSNPPASFLDIGAYDAIRLNTPSNFNLVYNNTTFGGPGLGYWGRNFKRDMYGDYVINNIFPGSFRITESAIAGPNLNQDVKPDFINPEQTNFELKSSSLAIDSAYKLANIHNDYVGESPDFGAYEFGRKAWKSGHDFNASPKPEFIAFKTDFMNLIQNNGFEDGVNSWNNTSSKLISLVKQDSWGIETADTRMQSHAISLLNSDVEINQAVSGLKTKKRYTLSAWIKTKKQGVGEISIQFGTFKKSIKTSKMDTWEFIKFDFELQNSVTSAKVSIKNIGEGGSEIYCDDVGLIQSIN
ncbi:right-handed parallel beta-helix repeat-containing protein [Mariniflexile sp. AS56]|uniref:right-handed parallel beta-helix repeat-containing protein n=1 Tax=Mariniflexile sp. AS56 TaxID=3063957 RepID=UPI0026F1B9E2|nr:right-handed parallel beta-helix repeat-containing protein [Mariniflexile sp. AS56]MDO7172515.1 right-handed parallel beta-helix repeat-containing protein [Mariniflexile sp. AS56]